MKKKNKLMANVFCLMSSKRGYTLVELLAVTGLIVVVSGIISGVLFQTLRGGNKTKATNDVAQNGNYAVSIISNAALLAESVTKVGTTDVVDCTIKQSGSSIEFLKTDGTKVTYACTGDPSATITTSDGVTTNNLIDTSSVKLDTNPTKTCQFSCFQPSLDPYAHPIIGIKFTLIQKLQSKVDNSASSSFDTSVTMRNFSP